MHHEKYSAADIIKMLEYLIDNIFLEFGGRIFQLTVCIPMDTNCAPLLTNLFLYSYEAEFVQKKVREKSRECHNHKPQPFPDPSKQARNTMHSNSMSPTDIYIYVLSLKNSQFAEYMEFIYPRELEIKQTTETAASSSYLECYLYIGYGKLTIRFYDKRDDFNFPIVNFPFLSSNIPSARTYVLN